MNLGYPGRQKQLEKLVEKLGLPKNASIKWELLHLALTHASASATANYEQLEFIGDAVVRLAASQLLFEIYPDCSVGEFAAIRSILVSDRILCKIADSYGFDRYLIVASSAASDKTGAETRMADALEAVLAALYLSAGTLELIRPWLDPHFRQLAAEIRRDPARQNYKAALQELTQGKHKVLPKYHVLETGTTQGGEDRFTAEVRVHGNLLARGTGRSIKAAEQAAAREAFIKLNDA
ncbi:MAG: ribonuclease III [Oscillatoriaceae cyanobacterium Prado104]|jgi:ribonuclease-3|nr:ribonuclease III [Oscillatoriaceae cyanobacterium Prado104]